MVTATPAPQGCSAVPSTAVGGVADATGSYTVHFTLSQAATMGNAPDMPLGFSPDGRWLALATREGVTLYDGKTLSPRLSCPFPIGVLSLAFAPNSASLTVGGVTVDAVTWHLPGGELANVATLASPGIQRIAYAPDGTNFAVARSGVVSLFRSGDSRPTWTIEAPRGNIGDMVFSVDGQTIVVADTGVNDPHETTAMTVRWLSVTDGGIREQRTGPIAYRIAVSPDRRFLARWRGSDAALELVPLDDTSATPSYKFYPAKRVTVVGFVAEGSLLAAGDEEGGITLRNLGNGQPTQRLTIHTGAVSNLASSPDGTLIASASPDGVVRLTPVSLWR